MSDALPRYTFLPWSRRGIATRIDQTDHLGSTPAAGPAGRATLTAEVTVDSVAVPGAPSVAPTAITRAVSLVGPGDVKALKPEAVIRVHPAPGALTATPGELALAEFYDEDLPWRYTPARATTSHRLRPWLVLLVLEEGEFTLLRRPGQPSIVVVDEAAPLPSPTETWAWAHVQVSGTLAGPEALDAFVAANPDLALSRVLSPRRLLPDRGYGGFLVPAFESGRLAGLGTPDETVPAQAPAWGVGRPRRFPVLHEWAWRTGELSDFESLARRPQARVAGQDFGRRTMDVSEPGGGLPAAAGAAVDLEGALRPVGFSRTPFPAAPGTALATALQHLVDLHEDFRDAPPEEQPDDPIVTPPAYARVPAGLQRVADVAAVPEVAWLAELNLDPRNRAAAGLGSTIVRQRDTEYMERAWAQVSALAAVNQRLREADLALTANERIFAKHVAGTGADRRLALTSPAHTSLPAQGSTTVRGTVNGSRVPAAAAAPAFRRITRPQHTLVRGLTGATGRTLHQGLVGRLNATPGTSSAVSTAPPAADPAIGVSLSLVSTAVSAAAGQQVQEIRPRDRFLYLAHAEAGARGVAGFVGLGAATARTVLRQRLDATIPAPTNPADPITAVRAEIIEIIGGLAQLSTPAAGQVVLSLTPSVFTEHFGGGVDGKTYRGVTAAPQGSTFTSLSTATDPATVQQFVGSVSTFGSLAGTRPAPVPAAALTAPGTLADGIEARLRPRSALPARLATVVGGVGADLTAEVANFRRLRPVLAHPRFDDPLFEPLRLLSQDYVLPNIADLAPETIAVMEPNTRFIEALLAGASTEMARELLWNEYPTDQRGTYFPRFWDARDAGVSQAPPDIRDLHTWEGALGAQSGRAAGLLVLVVRAELLVRFPSTIVFAQRARFVATGGPRALDDAGPVRYPVLRGHLDPDIELYGFELDPATAAGGGTDPGWFFCFMERPGQVRFGLDSEGAPPPLATWDDLHWGHLQPAGSDEVRIAGNSPVPTTPGLPAWGATSAHMASILSQSPVLLARHASDMLPEGPTR